MQAGSLTGSTFVLMSGAVIPAGLNTNEIGIELHWKAGPAGKEFSSQYFVEKVATGGIRALTPLSPVHLKKLAQPNGDVNFTWIRRGRTDADNWLATEIPLGEAVESYRIRIVSVAAALIREAYSPVADWLWTAAMQAADAAAAPFSIEIAQMSEAAGAGIAARLTL